jgi:hypothetical protein
MTVPGPNASASDKIKWILDGYGDPTKHLDDDAETDTDKLQKDVAKVEIKDHEAIDFEEQIQSDFLALGRSGVLKKKKQEEENTQINKQDASPSS